jgi:tRNA (guanine-N7-)-methyltransferase
MGQNKLERFEAIKSFPNVFQFPEGQAGNWNQFFKNDNPITVELACGKGDYAVGMAKIFPDRNFLGVDIKGNRMYVGAKQSINENICNVAFLRTQILDLEKYFAVEEIKEIWITFPDPFLRESKTQKRLTSPRFLSIYQRILPKGAVINLKTDSTELYEYTLETIAEQGCNIVENIPNVYANGHPEGLLGIQTFYEKNHLLDGRIIKFVSFTLPDHPIVIPKKKSQLDTEKNK